MDQLEYCQPESCRAGGRYLLKCASDGMGWEFREVTFIGYRPHPGEVVVDAGEGPRIVHRLLLFQRGEDREESPGRGLPGQ